MAGREPGVAVEPAVVVGAESAEPVFDPRAVDDGARVELVVDAG